MNHWLDYKHLRATEHMYTVKTVRVYSAYTLVTISDKPGGQTLNSNIHPVHNGREYHLSINTGKHAT